MGFHGSAIDFAESVFFLTNLGYIESLHEKTKMMEGFKLLLCHRTTSTIGDVNEIKLLFCHDAGEQ